MNKEKIMKKLVELIAIRIAVSDANSTCPCIHYQPKVPGTVKKLRKF